MIAQEYELEQPEYFSSEVYRVAELPPRPGSTRPRFRIIRGHLSQQQAVAAARLGTNLFFRGRKVQVRNFANQVGGQLQRRVERHGDGLTHYHLIIPARHNRHVILPARRIHIWFAPRVPPGEFFN
jgi:hypothetical protein